MCSCSFGCGAACAPHRSVPELEVLGLGGKFIERDGARDARAASMFEEIFEEDAAVGADLAVRQLATLDERDDMWARDGVHGGRGWVADLTPAD